MTEKTADKGLVAEFLSVLDGLGWSGYEVEQRTDKEITSNDVSRWRRDDWSWLSGPKRRALKAFIAEHCDGQADPHAVRDFRPANGEPTIIPDPETAVSTSRVDQLLEMFAEPDGLRRMARRIPPKDLAKAALQIAIDDGWPEDEFDELYRRVKHMLVEDER